MKLREMPGKFYSVYSDAVVFIIVIDGLYLSIERYGLFYIRWEMTPVSVGGEQQFSISGGCQSPI